MLLSIIYEICLGLLALVAFPKFFYQAWRYGKYKESFRKRLGFDFPEIKKNGRCLIWLHAVSVGETRALAPLVKLLKAEDNPLILVSSTTETAHREAKVSLAMADFHVYLPFDFHYLTKRILRKTCPDLLILCETDFWFNFLKNAKTEGASIAVVNAKISERSLQRFNKIPFFSKALFGLIDFFCIQSQHYQKRFTQLGISSEKMLVTGNLKLDGEYPRLKEEEKAEWKRDLKIEPEDPVIVIGSTHDPEEHQLIEQFQKVWRQFPRLKILIVPRHPERFSEVKILFEKKQIPHFSYSQRASADPKARVILIDTMGLLRQCYQLSEIAIVAGSFISRVGGHNILEPCSYGIPVLFGPHMHSQPELLELIHHYQAGLQIPLEQISQTVIDLLSNPAKQKAMGQEGLRMLKEVNGATQRTWQALNRLILQISKNMHCVKI